MSLTEAGDSVFTEGPPGPGESKADDGLELTSQSVVEYGRADRSRSPLRGRSFLKY